MVLVVNKAHELEQLIEKASKLSLATYTVWCTHPQTTEPVHYNVLESPCTDCPTITICSVLSDFECDCCIQVWNLFSLCQVKHVMQVRDAGRTEVAAGSVTVLAVGGVTYFVDQVTGKLKTY